jgi:hypothetical protein
MEWRLLDQTFLEWLFPKSSGWITVAGPNSFGQRPVMHCTGDVIP